MKKIVTFLCAVLAGLALGASEIRSNYTLSGTTHISTEFEQVQQDLLLSASLEEVSFSDGSRIYLLHLKTGDSKPVPKGVKMAVNFTGGGFIRLEQIGKDIPGRLKYAMEPADLERILGEVSSLDIITGWNPEDYLQVSFKGNSFSALLKSHLETIRNAHGSTVTLEASLAGYETTATSIITAAKPIIAKGQSYIYNVILSQIHYKNGNGEDFDLSFLVGTDSKIRIPYDATVRFTLRDGSVTDLASNREEVNFVYVYPEKDQLRRMSMVGVASIAVISEGETVLEDVFPEGKEDFSHALRQELELLLSLEGNIF